MANGRVIWTLSDAMRFCHELGSHITGYAVGMTGSVLRHGVSSNDLDIIVFPLSTAADNDLNVLQAQFTTFGMHRLLTKEQVHVHWRSQGSLDEKHVEVWYYNLKRIDVFYLT